MKFIDPACKSPSATATGISGQRQIPALGQGANTERVTYDSGPMPPQTSSQAANQPTGFQLVGAARPIETLTPQQIQFNSDRQQQIDDAIKALQLNTYGWPVKYDPGANDTVAGNTRPEPGYINSRIGVHIGPNAFSGPPGDFLSTIDHEVSGHLAQQHQGILAPRYTPGNYMNEVQAYDRELADAKMTNADTGSILNNRNYYFNLLDAENQARIRNGIYRPHP